MANTYDWRINCLDTKIKQDKKSNVVYNVHWSYIAKDDSETPYMASSIGTYGVAYDKSNFITYSKLTKEEQCEWENLTSVNSNSMILHPLVHTHPISGIKSVWLHLGMTGAVIRYDPETGTHNLLEEKELRRLMKRYNQHQFQLYRRFFQSATTQGEINETCSRPRWI